MEAFVLYHLEDDVLIEERKFQVYAAKLIAESSIVRNIVIAPGGINTFVYPIEGNENVPGHNLLTDERENVRVDVQRAIDTREIALSGPYELRQGGLGLVARKAVFHNDEFWGLVTMVIDLPPLFTESDLSDLNEINGALLTSDNQVIFGDTHVLDQNPVRTMILLPEGYWILAAIPTNGWESIISAKIAFLELFLFTICFLFLIILSRFYWNAFKYKSLYLANAFEVYKKNKHISKLKKEIKHFEKTTLSLTENAKDCIYRITVHPDFAVDYINPTISDLTGYESEAFYQSPDLFFGMHEGNEFVALISRAKDKLLVEETIICIWKTIDHTRIWVEESNVCLYDENGVLEKIEGIARDISDIKKMEIALTENQEKFQQLAESIKEVFWLRDRKTGKMLYISPAYEEIWGQSRLSLYRDSKAFIENIHPEDVENVRNAQIALSNSNVPFDEEYRIIGKDGSIRWIWARSFPVYNDQDEVIRYAGIAEDITEIRNFRDKQKIINALSIALRPIIETSALIKELLNQIDRSIAQEAAAIVLTDSETQKNLVVCASGKFSELRGRKIDTNLGIVANAINKNQNFYQEKLPHGRIPEFEQFYLPVFLVSPLSDGEQALGAIVIGHSKKFTAFEKEVIEEISSIAANAIRRSISLEKMNVSIKRLELIHEIDKLLNNQNNINNCLEKIFSMVIGEIDLDFVNLYQLGEDDHLKQLISYRDSKLSLSENNTLSFRACYFYKGIQKGQEVYEYGLPANNFVYIENESQAPIWCWAVPIMSHSKVLGVLELINLSPFLPSQDWQQFVRTISGQLSILFENEMINSELQMAHTNLIAAYDKTLEGWAKALELRDHETENHSRRVTDLSVLLAKKLGFFECEVENLKHGALLHDIGKIGIPDKILLKPGPLDDSEWELMQKHPQVGYDLLKEIKYLASSLDIPLYHHEKWDGSGYPFGLSGDDIPLSARIFAVSDVWDALTSDRPYRKAWDEFRAFKFILDQSGKHFDPQVVRCFRELYLNEEINKAS
jgi:PAS domain S-box-containing protein/putative nucleotidyltransferase with HDIG domain